MSARPIRVLSALPGVPPEVSVLVADDCDELRELVCSALRGTAGIGTVSEAARAMEAVVQAAWCRPDVVVLDFDLAGADTDRLVCDVSTQVPNAALIGFSGYGIDHLRPTAQAMLSLHLDKRTPLAQLCASVLELGSREVGSGRRAAAGARRRSAVPVSRAASLTG
jgi:CheY-like chemotaxis protein